jgi:ABC-type branched-subunit amino acid transport system substrate-binding protein
MLQKLKLLALFCALCAGIWYIPGAKGKQTPAQQADATSVSATEQTRGLTREERRGRAIYQRGASTVGREIVATIGELEVPSTTVNCAGCHGLKGEGKTEGGVTAGNLTWANLTKPSGHTHPSGRKHGPMSESSFINAVVRGIDPAQNRLAVAMPRYQMAPEDMGDLIAYLKHIEFERDPGVTAESVEIAVPLPATGPLADVGAAMREVLAAYFDEVNSRGGIYKRKIKLHVAESGDGSAAAVMQTVRLLTLQGQTFAFVSGLSAGADREVADFALGEEVPFVFPSTLLPQTAQPPNRYIFYLMPGLVEQTKALINFADASSSFKDTPAAIVYPEEQLAVSAASAAVIQAQQKHWSKIIKRSYAREAFDAVRLAQELKGQRTESIFFFGSGAQSASLISAARALDWTPSIFLLGVLSGQDLIGAIPPLAKQRIFLAFPTIPTDVTAEGASEYSALRDKYHLSSRQKSAQLSALAAAKTFVEGLKGAGADLSREQLITALEGLYDYDTGLTPHLIFGPNRHIGAAGAYMVTIDPQTKDFAAASGWVPVN